jgi:hypothetical protein
MAMADGAMLKLDNQNNGWKGVCVYQEANGKEHLCLVCALGRRFLHLLNHGADGKTFFLTYWMAKKRGM